MQRALALAFRAPLDFPHPPLNRANEERDLAERKILSPRKNKPPFSLPRTLARLSIVLPFPQPPPVRFLFHPGHNAKIARRLLHCPLPPPYSPHRRYKTCKIEKTPAFQCLYYMYTRTCTWARVCGWRPRVNGYGTHWGEGRGRREVRGAEDTLGERSIVIPTDPSFQHSSLAQQAGYTVTTMTTMTMVTMMSMTNVESSLSLSLFSSSHLPSWWLIQWSSRETALVDSCSLFPWLFVAFGLDHRKSSSIVRFFRKLAVPVSLGSKGDYTWRRFFFERERYDRSRNISTASGAEFWDEYRSGFGWRRRN